MQIQANSGVQTKITCLKTGKILKLKKQKNTLTGLGGNRFAYACLNRGNAAIVSNFSAVLKKTGTDTLVRGWSQPNLATPPIGTRKTNITISVNFTNTSRQQYTGLTLYNRDFSSISSVSSSNAFAQILNYDETFPALSRVQLTWFWNMTSFNSNSVNEQMAKLIIGDSSSGNWDLSDCRVAYRTSSSDQVRNYILFGDAPSQVATQLQTVEFPMNAVSFSNATTIREIAVMRVFNGDPSIKIIGDTTQRSYNAGGGIAGSGYFRCRFT